MVILFDLDGTLIDSTEAVHEGFCVAFDAHGKPPLTQTSVTSLIGLPLDIMFERLGVLQEEIPSYIDAYKVHYRTIAKPKTKLLECAREAVHLASEFARVGIVTTKTSRYSKELLEHMEIMHYFEVIIGREDVLHPKPHPEPIHKALESMQLSPNDRTWMVGDTCLDVLAAQEAGIQHVALTSGYGDAESIRLCATNICHDATEAVRLIQSNL